MPTVKSNSPNMFKGLVDHHKSTTLNLLANTKVYQSTFYPHHVHPSSDLVHNESYKNVFDPTRIVTTYPAPLLTENAGRGVENIALKLVQQKNQYLYNVRTASTCFEKAKKTPNAAALNNRNIYSIHLKRVIELVEQDPDPYFFGSYNWYYTGGNLEILPLADDINIMMNITGPNFNQMNFSVLNVDEGTVELESLHHSTEKQAVFEVFKSNNNRYVALRQKNFFKIICIDTDYSKESLKTKQFFSDIPFISGTFQGRSHFMSIDMFRRVQRFDLATERGAGIRKMPRASNNNYWCQLKSYRHRLFFADTKSIEIFDNRLFTKRDTRGLKVNLGKMMESCEDITCLQMCNNENNFQVATSHHLFTFDIRKCSGAASQLTRSTHQFKTPPLIMSSLCESRSRSSTESFLAVAGSWADDVSLCRMTRNHAVRTVERTPLRKILTINNSYEKLRERGLLHDTKMDLTSAKDRAKRVTTGLRLYNHDSELYLFTQNCYGELFYQNVNAQSPDFYEEPEFTDRHVNEWRNMLQISGGEDRSSQLVASTVTNFNSIQNVLKYNLPMANEEDQLDDEKTYIPKWRRSVEQLSQYKDILATDLLSVWSIRTLKSDEDKADPKQLVESWLNTATPTHRPPVFVSPNKASMLGDGFR